MLYPQCYVYFIYYLRLFLDIILFILVNFIYIYIYKAEKYKIKSRSDLRLMIDNGVIAYTVSEFYDMCFNALIFYSVYSFVRK